jgi:uncharacterized protein YeaO (DUF488 family)
MEVASEVLWLANCAPSGDWIGAHSPKTHLYKTFHHEEEVYSNFLASILVGCSDSEKGGPKST